MKQPTLVQSVLAGQLLQRRVLPPAVLRATAELSGGAEDVAALLAARLDLPADLRANARADRRATVRAAYASRADLDTAELWDLLGQETRAVVLTAMPTTDAAVCEIVWHRFLAKPTKALACWVLDSLRSYGLGNRVDPQLSPDVPLPLVVSALTALGPDPAVDTGTQVALSRLADYLRSTPDSAALARLVVGDARVPQTLRDAAAWRAHVTAEARLALLEDRWVRPLRAAAGPDVEGKMYATSYANLRYAPGLEVDVLARVLTAPDVQPAVLARAGSVLDELGRTVPAAWVTQWRRLLSKYTPTDAQDGCEQCVAADAAATTSWPPAGWAPPVRVVPERFTGPGAGEPAAEPAPAPEPDVEDFADADLGAFNDYELAHLVEDGLDASRLPDVELRAVASQSTVLLLALLRRPEVDSARACELLGHAWWFAPAGQALVRVVAARPGDVPFALAAAGSATTDLLAAFGPGVFAEPGQPAAQGALRFARHVGAVVAGEPCPGWAKWVQVRDGSCDDSQWQGAVTSALAVFLTHPDTDDAAVLALPWPVVAAATGMTTHPFVSRYSDVTPKVQDALTGACAALLGSSTTAWVTFDRLGESFTGSASELLEVSAACAL